MLCPTCRQPQLIVEFEGVELDLCLDGHGCWFDDQELRILLEELDAPAALAAFESRLRKVTAPDQGPRRPCPRCDAKMDHVQAPAGEDYDAGPILDRCPHGHGIWFDQGELEQALTIGSSVDDPEFERIRAHLSAFESASPNPATEEN